jgi:hypothetical protein
MTEICTKGYLELSSSCDVGTLLWFGQVREGLMARGLSQGGTSALRLTFCPTFSSSYGLWLAGAGAGETLGKELWCSVTKARGS